MDPWQTLSKETLLDHSKYLRVEQHRVLLPNGQIIPDWPWLETPDFVMVLPEMTSGEFAVLRQTKYAIEGLSLATAGGIIEPEEEPIQAAKRELREEMGIQAKEWIALGAYRVNGNYGDGIAHLYLARGALQTSPPGADDLEEQELLFLSYQDLLTALLAGDFKALPWALAPALALLHLQFPHSQE